MHVRTGNNDGYRLDNSDNSNRIGAQMLNTASVGSVIVYATDGTTDTMKMVGTGYIEGAEVSAPSAPAANYGRMYFRVGVRRLTPFTRRRTASYGRTTSSSTS